MEFIHQEYSFENSQLLVLSDDEDELTNDEMENFIDDRDWPEDGVSFCRQLDPENIENYHEFPYQTRNPIEATYEDAEPYYGSEDRQPELYNPEDRDEVTFDKFRGFKKSDKQFKETFKKFGDSKNQFFAAVVYGVMFYKSEGKTMNKDKVEKRIRADFYNDLLEMKGNIKFDRTIFGFFDKCFLVDTALAKHNFFLKFFERRDDFRFLRQKKV